MPDDPFKDLGGIVTCFLSHRPDVDRRFVLPRIVGDELDILLGLVDGQARTLVFLTVFSQIIRPLPAIVAVGIGKLDIGQIQPAAIFLPILTSLEPVLCFLHDLIVRGHILEDVVVGITRHGNQSLGVKPSTPAPLNLDRRNDRLLLLAWEACCLPSFRRRNSEERQPGYSPNYGAAPSF